jgi:non-heme chloroperoxidase
MNPRLHSFLLASLLALAAAACASRAGEPARAGEAAAAARAAQSSSETALMRAKSRDGVELLVAQRGPRDAQAIVLIHGLGFSHEVWQRQWESELGQRFHLIAYDLRGHGRSARPTEASAYQEGDRWAQDLEAVLTATQAKRPIVVGWSLGGLVVAHYLRVFGDEALGGLVLVDAVTKLSPEVFAPGNQQYLAGLSDPDDGKRAAATRAFLRVCFARPLPEATFEALAQAAGVLPVWEQQAIQGISLEGVASALQGSRKPTRVIHGVHDVLVAEAMARYSLSLMPQAQLVLFEESGHAPFVDEAARFNEELERLAAASSEGSQMP